MESLRADQKKKGLGKGNKQKNDFNLQNCFIFEVTMFITFYDP